jgi:hypothetical protein
MKSLSPTNFGVAAVRRWSRPRSHERGYIGALSAIVLLIAQAAHADAPATPATPDAPAASSAPVPTASFPASRYQALWSKSPFAVATSETVGEESPDYLLFGLAKIDGISYASVVEAKPPQEHFLISTDKPTRGMTLKSINHGHDATDTYVVVEKDGQSLTLKLQQASAANEPAGAPQIGGMPGNFAPQIPMPGSSSYPNAPSVRPFPRFHRPPIHLPNSPGYPAPPPQPQPQAGLPQVPVPQPAPAPPPPPP